MSEDTTKILPPTFEERVLSEFSSIREELSAIRQELSQQGTRLSSLEEKVDERLRETRPIWENVQQRLTEIESGVTRLNRQFRIFVADAFDLRSRVEALEDSQSGT